MKGTKSAGRYALSLLELSEEMKNSSAIEKDMQAIVIASDNKDFHLFITSPIISAEKKIAIFNQLFPHFNELTKKFIALVTNKGREYELSYIADSYCKQLKKIQGISEVILTSTVHLDDAIKKTILEKIKPFTLEKVEMIEKIDKNLIGGFTIQIDDQMIDASVSNQLKDMKQFLN